MAGAKGFRNLPKLARLKRGRARPTTRAHATGPARALTARVEAAALRLDALPPEIGDLLRSIALALRDRELFLVGGVVRDALLGREFARDLDLALPAHALTAARIVADTFGGAYFPLDEARGVARVVLHAAGAKVQIDLADFRAPTLDADLKARDFTINALAVDLPRLSLHGRAPVIDPTGGLADLHRRRLRLSGPESLEADPLRALRAVRLAHQLNFTIEPRTRAAIRPHAPRLVESARERVRDEWLLIVALSNTVPALRELDRLGLLAAIIPEIEAMKGAPQPKPHRFTVWEHSLKTVASLDRLLADLSLLAPFSEELSRHLEEELDGGVTRRQILKLAGLLHDVAKPLTREEIDGRVRFIGHDTRGAEIATAIAERLRLPSRATRSLAQLVRHHLRPMHLGQLETVSRRARYRFARDLADDAQALLLLALADAAAVTGANPGSVWRSPGGRLVASLLEGWKEAAEAARAPSLLRGEDVMTAFGLTPGPEVGRLLNAAREAQAVGLVTTKEGALAHLADWRAGAEPGGEEGVPPRSPNGR